MFNIFALHWKIYETFSDLEGISFVEVDSTLFSDAFSRLKHFYLQNTFGYCASDDQVEALLTKILILNKIQIQSKMKSLHLTLINLSHIDTNILQSLLTSNIKIQLRDCTITETQLSNLSDSKMEVEVSDRIGNKIIINYPSICQRQAIIM